MNYTGAIFYIFRQPNWMKNLAMQAVCILIPVIGPLVLMGYMRDVFLDLHADPKAPCRAFSFDRFSYYLGRGVWPFVVNLVASMLMLPVIWALMAGWFVITAVLHMQGPQRVLFAIAGGLLYMVVIVVFQLVIGPLTLRALLMQDFKPSFNRAFLADFIWKMWPQLLLKQLFLMVVAIPILIAGLLVLCVGIYPAAALLSMAHWLLLFTVYENYLTRGGQEIPIKPLPGDGGPHGFEVQPTVGA